MCLVTASHPRTPRMIENLVLGSKGTSFYIAQYPILRTIQSTLHYTSLTDLFTQTPSRLLWEASSHMLHLMRDGCSYTYPPLSKGRYSFIKLSELEQCRVKKFAQGFNTAAQDSNPGSRSRKSEALPLSHCTLQGRLWWIRDEDSNQCKGCECCVGKGRELSHVDAKTH